MRESVSAACIKSYDKAEKGTLSPLECLSFANTIQADLLTCGLVLILPNLVHALRTIWQAEKRYMHSVRMDEHNLNTALFLPTVIWFVCETPPLNFVTSYIIIIVYSSIHIIHCATASQDLN